MANMASALEDNISRLTGGCTEQEREVSKGVKVEPGEKPKSQGHRVLIEEIDDEYTSCMKDVNDALIPVRAHGLVTIRRLIEKRDETVMIVIFLLLRSLRKFVFLLV